MALRKPAHSRVRPAAVGDVISHSTERPNTTTRTNTRNHADPSPQACDCTRNCWSSRSGCHGPIVCCADQRHVDQGGGAGRDDRRPLSGVSGLSLPNVLGLSHLLLLRISHLLLLRISALLEL